MSFPALIGLKPAGLVDSPLAKASRKYLALLRDYKVNSSPCEIGRSFTPLGAVVQDEFPPALAGGNFSQNPLGFSPTVTVKVLELTVIIGLKPAAAE